MNLNRFAIPTTRNSARSRNMRAVRGKDTRTELIVRSTANAMGLRFRLFRPDLPGRPDLTFARWGTVLFVNGCFWHQHSKCKRSALPKTNVEFWRRKLARNVERDQDNYSLLKRAGWRVLVIWECEVKRNKTSTKLQKWFKQARSAGGRCLALTDAVAGDIN
jgi:DNA mismatch endonuclease, patch repair protein